MLQLDTLETLMAAVLVLLVGRQILARTALLRKYSIPEPAFSRIHHQSYCRR
ncbi:Sodium/glutamate symporter [Caballeronia arvi]|uniref:Sodium/glutamate symporter n=1 Tax=Caballeronia arvi TaxID=1777135 RepID=A0A158L672_9BURK|nr:sodium/glutamate symporter [Caballeronia arvi]SAL88519.1 Sodium/glutamate symporter [Caballeronia arvi]